MPSRRLRMRSTYERSTLPGESFAQPAFMKNRRRAYCPGLRRLSIRGFTTMPLPESPVPPRWAWPSQTCAGSRPSQALRTSSCRARRGCRPAMHVFQKPCSGHWLHAAIKPAPAMTAPRARQGVEREHADHAALLEDHERAEVLLRHRRDRVHRAARGLDAEQAVALYTQDLFGLHGGAPPAGRMLSSELAKQDCRKAKQQAHAHHD